MNENLRDQCPGIDDPGAACTCFALPEPSGSEPAPDAAAFALKVAEQQMCPNCVTPWKCNGPHIEQPAPDADREAGGE